MASKIKILAGVIIIILILIASLLYQSYTSVDVTVTDISLGSPPIEVDKGKAILLGAATLATGGAALPYLIEAIEGMNLEINIEARNGGVLPVYIPTVSYDLYINENYVGDGVLDREVTIDPGESELITIYQFINRESLLEVVASIVENDGLADIRVIGEARVSIMGQSFSIPFEQNTTINVYEEVSRALNEFLESYSGDDEDSGQPSSGESEPSVGRLEVSAVYWIHNGEYVYMVPQGSNVTVRVVLTAVGGDVEGPVVIRVKRDLAMMPDEVYLEESEYVSLREGESIVLEFWFIAEDRSGLVFRGYFIEIILPDGSKWTMESDYPPRLEVT